MSIIYFTLHFVTFDLKIFLFACYQKFAQSDFPLVQRATRVTLKANIRRWSNCAFFAQAWTEQAEIPVTKDQTVEYSFYLTTLAQTKTNFATSFCLAIKPDNKGNHHAFRNVEIFRPLPHENEKSFLFRVRENFYKSSCMTW